MKKKPRKITVDPIQLKERTAANHCLIQEVRAKGFNVIFEYDFEDEWFEDNNAIQTRCTIYKISKDKTRKISAGGSTYWNKETDAQNRKFARAVAFERAYVAFNKHIKV